MAKWECEEHFLSDDIHIISKDDGSSTRRFTEHDEAEAYYEQLKREEVQDSIARNLAVSIEQNKAIIANQQRLIEEQKQKRQILEPACKESLQFKVERWIAEQKRVRIKTEDSRKEEENYFNDKLKLYRESKGKLSESIKMFNEVSKIYMTLMSLQFKESRELEYETEDGYETLKLSGGQIIFEKNEDILKQYYSSIKDSHIETINLDILETMLTEMSEKFLRYSFDKEYEKAYNLFWLFRGFYGQLYLSVNFANKKFDSYIEAITNGWYGYIICTNGPHSYYPEPIGFFNKLRFRNIIKDYLNNNRSNIETLKRLTNEIENAVDKVGISIDYTNWINPFSGYVRYFN